MAKVTPLLVSLRGKLGANVFERGNRVRAYVSPAFGGDARAQCAFANLSRQWPFSAPSFKAICATKYRHGCPDGGLARQVPFLMSAEGAGSPMTFITRDLMCPDQLDVLPGKYGVRWQMLPSGVAGKWVSSGFRLRWAVHPARTWTGTTYMAYLIMPVVPSLYGHDESNLWPEWAGVQVIDWDDCGGPSAFEYIDTRLLPGVKSCGAVWMGNVAWYVDAYTLERVMVMGSWCKVADTL